MSAVKCLYSKPVFSSSHSGHFTTSNLNDDNDYVTGLGREFGVEEVRIDNYKSPSRTGQTDSQQNDQNQQIIENTFEKLFACMTIAYNSQLSTPKFKAFKGLKVTVKDKMRLNNIIWREWYSQFKHNKSPHVCCFNVNVEDVHRRPQVIIMEGKYWKRSRKVVCVEYLKWRVFNKNRIRTKAANGLEIEELLEQVGKQDHSSINNFVNSQNIVAHYSPPELDYKMDLTDDIFNTLQSVGFPHQTSRDFLGLENSDFMQPALISLEPDLPFSDLDTRDPLHDLFSDAVGLHVEKIYMPGQKRSGTLEHYENNFNQSPIPPPPPYPLHKKTRIAATSSPSMGGAITSSSSRDFVFTAPAAPSSVGPHARISHPHQQRPQQHHHQQHMTYDNNNVCSTQSGLITQMSQPPSNTLALNSLPQAHKPIVTTNLTTNANHFKQRGVASELLSTTSQVNFNRFPPSQDVSFLPPPTPASLFNIQDQFQANEDPLDSLLSEMSSDIYSLKTSVADGGQVPKQKQPEKQHQPLKQDNPKDKGKTPVVIPKPTQKSAFLTQLLRNPLERDNPMVAPPVPTRTAPSSSSHMTSPVGFSPMSCSWNDVSMVSSSSQDKSRKRTDSSEFGEFENAFPIKNSPEDQKDVETAEQRRRKQIKTGFDVLLNILPNIPTSSASKTSKATMLTKTVDYINQLHTEKERMEAETKLLKEEIEAVNSSILECQQKLPITGVPLLSHDRERMKCMLDTHVANQTLNNWKYYILSRIISPQFNTFYSTVSTASLEELCRSTEAWLDQHCSLTALRTSTLTTLRELSKETSILTDPSQFPDQARAAVLKQSNTWPG